MGSAVQKVPDTKAAMPGKIQYSIVIPVYGSASILPELHKRLSHVMKSLKSGYEIIYVDDCGPGDSWSVIESLAKRDSAVSAIQLMRNSGQSSATLCGMAHSKGEVVLTIDDDLQHPPEEIPRLLHALTREVDVVMGVPRQKKHHWFRRLGSRLLHEINSFVLGKNPNLRFTSFRALRRHVVDNLLELRTLSPALGPMINSVSQRIVNTVTEHAPRVAGESGYTARQLTKLVLSNMIGYSMFPLRLLGVIGGIGILLSSSYAVYLLCRYVINGSAVPGWTSTTILLTLLFGFNFFAFAIIGEYLLRILQRANATPQYFIRTTISNGDVIGEKIHLSSGELKSS